MYIVHIYIYIHTTYTVYIYIYIWYIPISPIVFPLKKMLPATQQPMTLWRSLVRPSTKHIFTPWRSGHQNVTSYHELVGGC